MEQTMNNPANENSEALHTYQYGKEEALLERLIFSHRPMLLLVFLLATVFFAYQITKLKPDASFEKMIPMEHPFVQAFMKHMSDLGAAGTQVVVHRVPGSTGFATSSQTGFRGALQVGSTLYSAWSGKVYKCGSGGGALEALTGNLTGTARVFMARNNAATPDLVVVSPGDGAFVASTTAVSSYPDADVGSPNAVCEHKSFFIFTRGNGTIIATGPNSTAINTLDTATAKYKPDTAYRPMSYKDNLLIWGSESVEFWGGLNDTGFPFSFISAMDIGIVGPYAVGGDTDGFHNFTATGKGVYHPSPNSEVGLIARYVSANTNFDDFDYSIGQSADAPLSSSAEAFALRGYARLDLYDGRWSQQVEAVLNDTRNTNYRSEEHTSDSSH